MIPGTHKLSQLEIKLLNALQKTMHVYLCNSCGKSLKLPKKRVKR